MPATSYLESVSKPLSGKPNTVDGVTFRPYRSGILNYVRISDDGQIKVWNSHGNAVMYCAAVFGHGFIAGKDPNRARRFRSRDVAIRTAIKLFNERKATTK